MSGQTQSPAVLRSLDGLRAIAIALVMLYHCGAPAMTAGWLGVDLFFVISGFLITTLLVNENARFRSGARGVLKMFWARRFLRLMPVYVFYITALTLMIWLGRPGSVRDSGGWTPLTFTASLWTYLANLPPQGGIWDHQFLARHLWSLSVEEQFYFLWPGILLLLLRTKLAEQAAWTLAAFVIFQNLVLYRAHPPHLLLHARGVGLFVGCAAAIALVGRRAWLERRGLLSPTAALVAAALAAASFAAVTIAVQQWHIGELGGLTYGVPLFALGSAWLIANLWAKTAGSVLTRSLEFGPLPRLGTLSYSAYVWHMAVWYVVWHVLLPGIEGWPKLAKFGVRVSVFFVLTFAVAQLSYLVIERPFLKVKERFRLERRAATGAGSPIEPASVTGRS